jgi:NAD(P)-dependent dehydrogenase (short-subunit alcohol dehydrogenase family)
MTPRCVLVTGAASGTGLGIARKFASEGWAVFLTSREEQKAGKAAEEIAGTFPVPVFGLALSPDDEDGVARMFRHIEKTGHKLDAAVLNAANLGFAMDPLEVDIGKWAEVIRTNIVWNFAICRCAALQMKDRGGSLVLVGSNTSRRAIKGRSAYIASKGGIHSLAKALAVDLGSYGIRVNTLMPGPIKTERWDSLPPSLKERKLARAPLGRIATYEDIANGAFFLASDLSADMTGAEIVIDGGLDGQLTNG